MVLTDTISAIFEFLLILFHHQVAHISLIPS